MPATETPTFTPLPDGPQRLTDTPAQFVSKADAFVAAMPTAGTQITAIGQAAEANARLAETKATAAEAAAETAVGATDYAATTSATLSLALGSTGSFTIDTGKAFQAGEQIGLISLANDAVRMTANVTSYNSVTGAMVADVTAFTGTGSAAGWSVLRRSLEGLSPDRVAALAIAFAVAL